MSGRTDAPAAQQLGFRAGRFKRGFGEDMRRIVIRPKVDLQESLAEVYFTVHRAHCIMLAERGIIPRPCAAALLDGLDRLGERRDWPHDYQLDDFYAVTEHRLAGLAGAEHAGRLHTARSRNDLDATTLRLAARQWVEDLLAELEDLVDALFELAQQHRATLMAEYTHLQHAQPGTLGHYLLGLAELLEGDAGRLEDALGRLNVCPLGAGAIGGTGFPIDRALTARLLGFDGVMHNSLACVSSREFAAEILSGCALFAINLSRAAEDLIAWNSVEFDVVELSDEFAGTSSLMPQKKNPISLETVRSRAARIQGLWIAATSTLKATNLGHNWDCYEIDPALREGVRSAADMARLVRGIYRSSTFRPARMLANLEQGCAAATELADTLVRSAGLPFRAAHLVVGRLVSECIAAQRPLKSVTPAQVGACAREMLGRDIVLCEQDIEAALDIGANVQRRDSPGGPAGPAFDACLQALQANAQARRQRRAQRLERYRLATRLLSEQRDRFRG